MHHTKRILAAAVKDAVVQSLRKLELEEDGACRWTELEKLSPQTHS